MERPNRRFVAVVCLAMAALAGGTRSSAQGTAVPSPWASRDIGSPAIAGAASFNQASSTFSIDAAGSDIWGTADQFQFVYQPLAGDVVITARVDTVSAAHAWSKAGVMIRSSLNADAAHGYVLVSAGKGSAFQRRPSVGGGSASTSGSATAVAPLWVRLARTGSTVTASTSSNGTTWTTIGSDTIALGATAYVGIAVTSHNVSQATSADVSAVTATSSPTAGLPPPQQSQDIGSPAVAGSATYSQGTYTVKAGGRDIYDNADQFHYVYQPVTGDVDVSVKVSSLTNVNDYTKAGVMIRENLTAGSAHAFAGVHTVEGYLFQRRPTANGATSHTNGGAGAPPGWVRLKRVGDLITAYRSADGTNWTVMGSASFPMAQSLYVGIAVTSHNVSTATTAVLTNLAINQTTPSNQPPTATLTAPANGATYTEPASVSITATAADSDGSVSRVDFYNGTTLLASDTTAPYAMTWSNVAAGTYSVTAKAVDNAGATGSSAVATITVSGNQAPTATLTAPANGATYTAPASITLTATAADTDGTVARVDFYNGTTLLGSDTTAPYSFAWSNVAAGTYPLKATAVDNTGATGSSAVATITVTGNQAPTATLTAPANGATFTAPASITLTASAADTDGTIARVEFYNGTTLLGSDTTSPYSFTWSNVAAGTYALKATAVDNTGATGSSAVATVTVGTNQPPTATLTAPANGATFTAPASITLTANAADANGTVARVEFYNGTTLLGSDTTAPYSFAWSNVAAGTYALKATAVDNAGATGSSSVATVTVSNPAPTATLTAPANGATFNAPATITLTANASDANGTVARVDFYNGSTLLGSDTTAPYAFTWSNVPAGTYALRATAVDNAGATGSSAVATITVSAALPPPTTVMFQAAADHATNVTSYLLEVFANGANPDTATPVASSDLGKPTPAANGDISVNRATFFSALAPGSYVLTVSSIGPGGKARSASLSFTR